MLTEIMNKHRDLAYSFGLEEEAYDRCIDFAERLWIANKELNLFSRKMPAKDLVENHIFDCLLAVPEFRKFGFKVLADFGSGGGMPGVLLAIAFSDKQVCLFEKSPKKREFLESQIEFVPNLKVYSEVSDEHLEHVDLVTARAFKPIEIILKLSHKYKKSGGSYMLYKGKKEIIDSELKGLNLKSVELIGLESPLLSVERHLVQIN